MRAESVILAEAAAQVEFGAELAIGLETEGYTAQRIVRRPLGHQVDRPTHRAAGRHAGKERVGSLEQLHPFEHFHRRMPDRQQAVHAIQGHVVLVDVEAANPEVLVGMPAGSGETNRWIVRQHIGDRTGLPIVDQFAGVTGHIERRVHYALVAKRSEPRSLGDLAAGIGQGRVVLGAAAGDGLGGQGQGLLVPGGGGGCFGVSEAREQHTSRQQRVTGRLDR
nr:hypothetical protein [Pseudomonas aeruginosa]